MCYERNGQCDLVLRRGKGVAEGIRLGRKRRSRMLVHRLDVAGGLATLLRLCIAGFDIGRG